MVTPRQEVHKRVAWLVARALSGAGSALAVVGEPGTGKSTLLDAAAARAAGALVLRATGVAVESSLPHAALHALLSPLSDRFPALPEVQRRALEVALGLRGGAPPSPFLLGAATLTLLSSAAETAPVLVVIDDAQWADEASLHALAFAGRRLGTERVGLLLASRTGEVPFALEDVERCELGPLEQAEALAVLSEHGVTGAVAQKVAAAAGGNPLALVELTRLLAEWQRAGGGPLPALPGRAELFANRVASLSPDAREAAGLAALALDAPAGVLAEARRWLGIDPDALHSAEEAGLLLAAADGVRWRHPLARTAVLEAIPPPRQRKLALHLADASRRVGAGEAVDVEFRLAAAEAPDESLATAIERVAVAANNVGDYERAARLWGQAADVGTDINRLPVRLLESAESTLHAGFGRLARSRYGNALAAGLSGDGLARAHLARGRIMHTADSPHVGVQEFRAAAAAAQNSALHVRACAEGVLAAMYSGAPDIALELAAEADAYADPQSPRDRMLAAHARGAALCLSGNAHDGRRLLFDAVREAERGQVLRDEPDLALWVVTAPLFGGGDPDIGAGVAAPAIEQLRLRGDLLWLPRVVRLWGVRHLLAGRTQAAYATFDEAVDLSRSAEQPTQLLEALSALAKLEAMRGEKESCLAHVRELRVLTPLVDVPFLTSASWHAEGLLHLALGDAAAAAAALLPALDVPAGVTWRAEAAADLIEALMLAGRHDEARVAAEQIPSLRAAALVAVGDQMAVELLTQAADEAQDPWERSRCRLLAGERLRRGGQRREAREHLRAAAQDFQRAGATPWQRRASDGLRSSGEVLSTGYSDVTALTGAELRVASLVAEGRSTREVAALLFLSPKTVEFHLGRIYRKLGVRGRTELARRVPDLLPVNVQRHLY